MPTATGWPTHWMTQTGEGKFSCWKWMQAWHDFMNKIYWSMILYFTLTKLWTTHSEWGFWPLRRAAHVPTVMCAWSPFKTFLFIVECSLASCRHCRWSFYFFILRLNVSIPTHVFVIATRCTDSHRSLKQCSTLQTLTFILPQMDTSREFNCQVLSSVTASQLTSLQDAVCVLRNLSLLVYCVALSHRFLW